MDDLVYVLDFLGLEVDAATIRLTARVNVSPRTTAAIEWDPDLRRTVMQLELPALVHFGYISDQEGAELGLRAAIEPSAAMQRPPRASN